MVLAGAVHAQSAEDAATGADAAAGEAADYPEVSGEVGLGLLRSSGNTDSSSVNTRAMAEIGYRVWRHTVEFSWFRTEEEDETTADRRTAVVQSDYRFSERSYLFANLSAERDRFGPFERRYTIAAGLGRRFVDTATVELDLEAGIGQRTEREQDTNDDESEVIARFDGDLDWQLNEFSSFSQDVNVQTGRSNTLTESESALRSRLTENLSWRLSYTVRHNTDPPADRTGTDTFTAVTLDYGF